MAIVNFPYRYTKYERMEHFIKWFQSKFQLRDWNIMFQYGSIIPKEFLELKNAQGACLPMIDLLVSKVWVNTEYCKRDNTNPLLVLCHEMLHVLFSANLMDNDNKVEDSVVNRLQNIIFENYLQEFGMGLTGIDEEWI